MREEQEKAKKLNLSDEEIAFYDALADHKIAVEVLGDDKLKMIASELVKTVRRNITIDWTIRESVKSFNFKYFVHAPYIDINLASMNPILRKASEKPILKPTKDYERYGKVPNVVFSCGNIKVDGEVLIYYGGADSVLCVATYELNELIPRK